MIRFHTVMDSAQLCKEVPSDIWWIVKCGIWIKGCIQVCNPLLHRFLHQNMLPLVPYVCCVIAWQALKRQSWVIEIQWSGLKITWESLCGTSTACGASFRNSSPSKVAGSWIRGSALLPRSATTGAAVRHHIHQCYITRGSLTAEWDAYSHVHTKSKACWPTPRLS